MNYSDCDMMLWQKIENFIGESIPQCIKKILISCGYDTMNSIQNLSHEGIAIIENHINSGNRKVITELSCCHSEFYIKQNTFHFLPGHRDFLLGMKNVLSKIDVNAQCSDQIDFSGFSVILKELVNTALKNKHNPPNNAKYSDIVRNFATYIFLLSGRSCYQVLSENLPFPSISTVCKYLSKKLKYQCVYNSQLNV